MMDDSTDSTSQATGPVEPGEESRAKAVTLSDYRRALLQDKVTLTCVAFLVILVVTAIAADLIAPFDPVEQSLRRRNLPPLSTSSEDTFHLLGTDPLGRDVLSRLIFGARVSIVVGVSGALIAGILGIVLGLVAGYFRGLTDDVIMRIVDAMMAFPGLLIALFVVFIFGAGLVNLVIIFAIVRWMVFARLTRGITLSQREGAMVAAAKAIGCRAPRIIFRHILPNIAAPLLVLFTLEVAILILAEASLSFLGFGIQPPASSWGLMIAQGRDYVSTAWWLVTLPGIAIFLTTISLNLVASWLRVVTDPAHQWRWMTQ